MAKETRQNSQLRPIAVALRDLDLDAANLRELVAGLQKRAVTILNDAKRSRGNYTNIHIARAKAAEVNKAASEKRDEDLLRAVALVREQLGDVHWNEIAESLNAIGFTPPHAALWNGHNLRTRHAGAKKRQKAP